MVQVCGAKSSTSTLGLRSPSSSLSGLHFWSSSRLTGFPGTNLWENNWSSSFSAGFPSVSSSIEEHRALTRNYIVPHQVTSDRSVASSFMSTLGCPYPDRSVKVKNYVLWTTGQDSVVKLSHLLLQVIYVDIYKAVLTIVFVGAKS